MPNAAWFHKPNPQTPSEYEMGKSFIKMYRLEEDTKDDLRILMHHQGFEAGLIEHILSETV